jgi:hypothetical protein
MIIKWDTFFLALGVKLSNLYASAQNIKHYKGRESIQFAASLPETQEIKKPRTSPVERPRPASNSAIARSLATPHRR